MRSNCKGPLRATVCSHSGEGHDRCISLAQTIEDPITRRNQWKGVAANFASRRNAAVNAGTASPWWEMSIYHSLGD